MANPLSTEEAYLLEITLEVMELAASIWAEVQTGAASLSSVAIERLGRCARIGALDQIKQLRSRYLEKKRLDDKTQRIRKKPLKHGQQQQKLEDGETQQQDAGG